MDDPEKPHMWVYGDKRMHAQRAPGSTYLNAIHNSPCGGTMDCPLNHSKGCGTVMRAAPFGLSIATTPSGNGLIGVQEVAMMDAELTHGHKLAWFSSGVLAQLIFQVVQCIDPNDRLEQVILRSSEDGNISPMLDRAVQLALDSSVSDLDGIHALGEGWVAEEALAIAVFCAVRYQDDFATAVRAAVNHRGDSDSTGAICGNILGAWLGKEAVESAFDLRNLELRDVIEKIAEQLYEAVEGSDNSEKEKSTCACCEIESVPPLRPVGLIYTPLVKKALRICYEAHRNQVDKGGMPYVIHPIHIAEQMETEEEVCTALLHDVIEDSPYAMQDLIQAGISKPVLEALKLMTRDENTDYLNYIVQLRKNPIARRVKMADLDHNSDLSRLDRVTTQDRRRVVKYRMARAILEEDKYDESTGHFCKMIPLALEHPFYLSVYYNQHGVVELYSIDIETADDSHYCFDVQEGEKLCQALGHAQTLPEALADWLEGRCHFIYVESMLQQHGIVFQPMHFYG